MKINEKLKKASLEAEITEYKKLPDDSEIDWEPSNEFNERMLSLLDSVQPPKRRFNTPARVAICAALIFVIGAFASVMLSPPDTPYNESSSEITEASQLSPNRDICPKYLPEGYSLSNRQISVDGMLVLEYSKEDSKILLYAYPDEKLDLSHFEEVIEIFELEDDVYLNANNFSPNGNIGAGLSNNIAWNNGKETLVVLNSDGVPVDELLKIAQSVEDGEDGYT